MPRVSALRRLLRPALLVVGGTGLFAGVFLLAVGLYYNFNANDGVPASHSLAMAAAADTGGIYDIPLPPGSVASPTPGPPLRDRPFRMVIPKIGVDAPVFTYGLDAFNVPEVPLNAVDVAWYDFSAKPGTGSNAVFSGHVTWNGPAVFYQLESLVVGDQVVLRGEDGTQVVYTVTEVFLVDPNDPASLSVMAPTPSDTITVITCGGTFFYTGDPQFGGDYTQRRIVKASLAGIIAPSPRRRSGA